MPARAPSLAKFSGSSLVERRLAAMGEPLPEPAAAGVAPLALPWNADTVGEASKAELVEFFKSRSVTSVESLDLS